MKKPIVLATSLIISVLSIPLTLSAEEVLLRTGSRIYADEAAGVTGETRHTYNVRVEAGALLEVIAASSEFDTWIDVVLPDGTEFSNDDYDGLNAGFIRRMPVTGQLVVRVSSLYTHQEGDYTLTVTELPRPGSIAIGDQVSGTITKGSYGQRRLVNLYYLTGQTGDHVVIDMLSDDFDAFLEVTDHNGRTRFDDDSGRGFNSRLSYRFEEAGSLIITAGSVLGESTGAYELRVTPFNRTVAARYDGRLRQGGRRAYDGRLFEVYEYNGRMGQSLTVELQSDDFDPVLYLSYADGRHFAMDDDSGGNGNSLLDVVLPSTETYRIFVTPFHEGEGAYRLTIYE